VLVAPPVVAPINDDGGIEPVDDAVAIVMNAVRKGSGRMSRRIAIAGYGAVGRSLASLLSARGDDVRVVQRQTPSGLPSNVTFCRANLQEEREAQAATAGAETVACTIGVPYDWQIYTRVWPVLMRNLLGACAKSGARFVFADNLYMYGPHDGPLTEDTPLTDYGQKPRVRAEITRLWQEAHDDGRMRAVAVRASDFYGPDVPTSVLSTLGIARLVAGKAALMPYPVEQPHDFTYVPDFARALATLIDAPDDAYGQAWHVPNAPTHSLRELLELAARLMGIPPRIITLPRIAAAVLGLFRRDIGELKEMRFQWDRPYLVDTTKFTRRFWNDPTPFDTGLQATIAFYQNHAGVSERN
jgi:nucleoside-diphosphate-sugar epimerase